MGRLSVSSITQGELRYGLARKPGAVNLQTAVREFLMRVAVLAWDSAAATRYRALRAALELCGTLLMLWGAPRNARAGQDADLANPDMNINRPSFVMREPS